MSDLEQQTAAALAAHEATLAGTVPEAPTEEPVVDAPAAPPVIEIRGLIRNAPRVAPAAR